MFEHLIGPLSPRMVPVVDPDYHHQKARALAEVRFSAIAVYIALHLDCDTRLTLRPTLKQTRRKVSRSPELQLRAFFTRDYLENGE